MKQNLLITLYVALGILLGFSSCCDKKEKESISPLAGSWRVVAYEDLETSTTITKTNSITWIKKNNGDVTIRFDGNTQTSGTFSGINVTNSFSGNYTLDSDDGFKVESFATTKINEPEWAIRFYSFSNAGNYEISNGELLIYTHNKTKRIRFSRI